MNHRRTFVATMCVLGLGLSMAGAPAVAQAPQTKDIVLDSINRPLAAGPAQDAMAVSVLIESASGALTARPTNTVFKTGERFRVKVLASRDGKVSLYNTTPDGRLTPKPVWQGQVRRGSELVTSRLRLDGMRGTDQLHVVLEPQLKTSTVEWLSSLLGGASKDIRLDWQHTDNATYLLGGPGKGLVTTLNIRHR
jgi:hypothetical protein